MKDIPIGDVLSKITGNVNRHEGGVVQMFLPKVLPPADDPPPGNFPGPLPSQTIPRSVRKFDCRLISKTTSGTAD